MFLNDLRNRLHIHAVPTIVNVSNPPKPVTVSRPLPRRRKLLQPDDTFERPEKKMKTSQTEKGTLFESDKYGKKMWVKFDDYSFVTYVNHLQLKVFDIHEKLLN